MGAATWDISPRRCGLSTVLLPGVSPARREVSEPLGGVGGRGGAVTTNSGAATGSSG